MRGTLRGCDEPDQSTMKNETAYLTETKRDQRGNGVLLLKVSRPVPEYILPTPQGINEDGGRKRTREGDREERKGVNWWILYLLVVARWSHNSYTHDFVSPIPGIFFPDVPNLQESL